MTDKLREERVRRVIAPLLSGVPLDERLPEDDVQYVEDLGLITRKPEVAVSHRIYREILPREITAPIQDFLHQPQPWYVRADRHLDLPNEATLAEGLAQTAGYADSVGAAEAYLIVFDRRAGQSWDSRIWQRTEVVAARTIGVWGM